MILFIGPARNEEIWVGRCVSAIQSEAKFFARYEFIVVDDTFERHEHRLAVAFLGTGGSCGCHSAAQHFLLCVAPA
jgi:hypothetical protein